MKKLIIFTLVLVNFIFMQDVGNKWSDEAKATFYLAERISPENALYYQLAMPLPFANLGYAYSDNWKRGATIDGIIIGTIVASTALYEDNDSWECDYYGDCGDSGLSNILLLGAMGLYIYKFIDAYKLAEEYNDKLYNRVFGGSRPYFSMEYDAQNKGSMLALNIPIGK